MISQRKYGLQWQRNWITEGERKMKCKCCNKKIKNQEFYLSDKGIIVCFICYIKTSKID